MSARVCLSAQSKNINDAYFVHSELTRASTCALRACANKSRGLRSIFLVSSSSKCTLSHFELFSMYRLVIIFLLSKMREKCLTANCHSVYDNLRRSNRSYRYLRQREKSSLISIVSYPNCTRRSRRYAQVRRCQ